MVLFSSTKLGIVKPSTNNQSLRRFDLVFRQTSKQIYTELKYRDKGFEEWQGLCRFRRKMILYSSTKFDILKPSTDIPWPRKFDWGFWQTWKEIFRKIQCRDKFLESPKLWKAPENWFCIHQLDLAFESLEPMFHGAKRFDRGFGRFQNKYLRNFNIRRKLFKSFHGFTRVTRKVVLYSSTKFGILSLERIFHHAEGWI